MQEPKYELYHYGTKGMKWGVRRFQNKDGTRTPAGLKRYSNRAKDGLKKAGDKLKEQYAKRKAEKAEEKQRKKPIKKLTNEELQARIDRLRMEKSYKDLLKEVNAPTISKGKSFVNGVLETSARNIATQTVTYVMGVGVNKALEKVFGEKVVNPKKGQKDK